MYQMQLMRNLIATLLLLLSLTARAQFPTHTKPDEKDAMLALLANAKEDTFKVKIYHSLISDYIVTQKEKRRYAQAMLALSQQLDYKKGIAAAYNSIGLTYAHSLAHEDRAMDNYNMARYYFEQVNDLHGLGGVICNMGNIYANRREYQRALDTLIKAEQLLAGIKDSFYLPITIYDIGACYYRMKDYDKGIQAYATANAFFKNRQIQQGMAGCYWAMGWCYLKQDRYEDALAMATLSLATAHKTACKKCVQLAEKLQRRARKMKS
jgi:tetratricopeptide (TPR) repeat protein